MAQPSPPGEFQTTVVANVDNVRIEAEISDGRGMLLATVYEDINCWHTELCGEVRISDNLNAHIERAKTKLCRYVNRRGIDPPEGWTRGAFALWLMEKDDGTAMGLNLTHF